MRTWIPVAMLALTPGSFGGEMLEFSLQAGDDGVTPRRSPQDRLKPELQPKKETKPSLAETGPRIEPVKQPDPAAIDSAIRRGVEFLIRNQNKNGSWGSAQLKHGVAIYAPVPGAHQA